MRPIIILLFLSIPFFCKGQPLLKSIYKPDFTYSYTASMVQHRDSAYSIFVKDWQVKVVHLDSFGNAVWTRGIEPMGCHMGDYLEMDTLSDSTVVLASNCYYTAFIDDVFLMKANRWGDALWAKSIGHPLFYEEVHCVKHTQDGGIIVVGEKWKNSLHAAKVYVLKTDSVGEVEWSRGFDRSDIDNGYDVLEADDGFVIAGSTRTEGVDASLGLLFKTDKSGNLLWQRGYGQPLSAVLSFIRDGDWYVLAGDSEPQFGGSDISGDVILVKTDINGNAIWTKRYNLGDKAYATKVIKANDGGYLLSGPFGQTSGDGQPYKDTHFFFLKTDVWGNVEWCKLYGGESHAYFGGHLQQKLNGNILAMTHYYTNSELLLLFETDSSGVGSGICETTIMPTEFSIMVADSIVALTDTTYDDMAVPVSFIAITDSFVSEDSCNKSPGVMALKNVATISSRLFPNPSAGIINIESAIGDYRVEIMDILGRCVYSGNTVNGKMIIDISLSPHGFYMCSLIANNAVMWREKFVLQ